VLVAVAILLGGPRLMAAIPGQCDASNGGGMTDAARFDELIHPATRLSIVALLAATDWAEFAFIRDQLALSNSALSKQLATLEESGYVTIERPLSERRRRVRARLTPLGRRRFAGHVAALRGIIANAIPES
jgi:DNA-binding MarR family transcriptional regulator